MTGYIGIGGTAKKIKNIYVGVGGVAKKVVKAYIGINGVAQLWYRQRTPSLSELFADWSKYAYDSISNGSGNFTIEKPSNAVVGETWYYFINIGSSLEICRVDIISSSSITKTRLSLTAASDDLKFESSVSGTSLVVTPKSGKSAIGGSTCAMFKFGTFTPSVIDYALSWCFKNKIKYYVSSAATTSNTNLRTSLSSVTGKSGIIMVSYICFESNSSSRPVVFGILDPSSPTSNPIVCFKNGTEYTDFTGLRATTSYVWPSLDGASTAQCYGYSLQNLQEDWDYS